jgi:hypothetical protein
VRAGRWRCGARPPSRGRRRALTPIHEHALCTDRAQLAEAAGERAQAATLYAEAAGRWPEFGQVPERADALLGQGRCLFSLGRPAAKVPLAEARELFTSLGLQARTRRHRGAARPGRGGRCVATARAPRTWPLPTWRWTYPIARDFDRLSSASRAPRRVEHDRGRGSRATGSDPERRAMPVSDQNVVLSPRAIRGRGARTQQISRSCRR